MDAAALAWLATEEGAHLLHTAAAAPQDRLARVTYVRKLCAPALANAVVEQLELRARARAKFAGADRMLFTPTGLEQSTGERIARYRASRFPPGVPILDACCGIGGDAIQLGQRGPVLSVDRDLPSSFCTAFNAGSVQTDNPVRAQCADVTTLNLPRLFAAGIRGAFLDPSRRSIDSHGTSRRIRNSDSYAPPLSWIENLRAIFPMVCVKVSPAIDDDALGACRCRVEFVSERGECKEAMLWLAEPPADRAAHGSAWDSCLYTATVLDGAGAASTLEPAACAPPEIAAPSEWILEPDAAVVRAHLTAVLAARHSLKLLDASNYYLTANSKIETPFANRYRLLEMLPLRPADVQKRCLALARRVTAIKTRWSSLAPEGLEKRILGAPKGAPPVVIIVAQVRGKQMALLCDPPGHW